MSRKWMCSSFTPENFAAARASVRRIRPLICCSSGLSTSPGFLLLDEALDLLLDRSALLLARGRTRGRTRATKSAWRRAVSSKTAMLPLSLVGDVHLVALLAQADERAAHADHVVVGVRAEDDDALGEDRRRWRGGRPGAVGLRRSSRRRGLPPGQPVMVACRSRKTSMLMSYAPPRLASSSCRPCSL